MCRHLRGGAEQRPRKVHSFSTNLWAKPELSEKSHLVSASTTRDRRTLARFVTLSGANTKFTVVDSDPSKLASNAPLA